MAAQQVSCHRCKHIWTVELALGRRDECPSCRGDAKVCLNCRYFDRGAHHECREEQAEWVKEKDRGNFCSYFVPHGGASLAEAAAEKARGKLDGLFGKSEEAPPQSRPPASMSEELKRFLDSKKR